MTESSQETQSAPIEDTEVETEDASEGAAPDPEQLAGMVEAVILTAERSVTSAKIAAVVGGASGKDVQQAIDRLNEQYEQTGRSFRIEKVAGGWQMVTLPRYAELLARLHQDRSSAKLSPAALETLAIIAYKQPVLRAEVETIRGVACGEVIRGLIDRRLVKIVGRAEDIGRPALYGTTRSFLELFGLSDLKDLPTVAQLNPPKS